MTANRIGMSSGTEFLFPWLGFLVLVNVTWSKSCIERSGSREVHLRGDQGDNVWLPQLCDWLDHGGGGVGGQMGRWVSHWLPKEHPRWEFKVLAWRRRRSQGWTRRTASARRGRRILVQAGGPVEPAQLVHHPENKYKINKFI